MTCFLPKYLNSHTDCLPPSRQKKKKTNPKRRKKTTLKHTSTKKKKGRSVGRYSSPVPPWPPEEAVAELQWQGYIHVSSGMPNWCLTQMPLLPPRTFSPQWYRWIKNPQTHNCKKKSSKEQGDSSGLPTPNRFSLQVLPCCVSDTAPSNKAISQCRPHSPQPQGCVTVLKMQRALAISSKDR